MVLMVKPELDSLGVKVFIVFTVQVRVDLVRE